MWYFLRGCVIIRINGRKPERLLERMREAGIELRDVRSLGPYEVEAALPAGDFRRLRTLARKSRCRVHIVGKRGLPFHTRRVWRRPALWVTALLALGLIAFASTRILTVRVVGLERVPEALVLRALRERGVYVGSPKPDEELLSLAAYVRGYDARIAWAEIKLNGVILTAEIVENPREVVFLDSDVPADVCAVKDGVITYVEAYEGKALVAKGDSVSAGDVLISGMIELPDTAGSLLVHARGRVMANVYYFGEAAADATAPALVDTGNSASYRKVLVCGLTLYESKSFYEKYEIRDVVARPVTNWMLPVTLCTGTVCEQAYAEVALSLDEQKQSALIEAEHLALLRVPKDAAIVHKTSAVFEHDGLVSAVVGVMTEESIGLKREMND